MRHRGTSPFRIRLRGGIFALALLALGACKDSTGSGPAPAPVLSSLSHAQADAGSGGFTLTVTGSGFRRQSVIRWDSAALATTYVNATTLTAAVSAARLQDGGTVGVTVSTPAPGGGTSAALPFSVRFPVPALSGLATDTARAGRLAAPVVATGTGFTPGTVVLWSGAPRPTTYVSPTQVTFVPDVAAAGAMQVTVRNPEPGGGTSAGLPFTVFHTIPTVTLLPSRGGVAGAPGYALTIHGTEFVPGTVATWNGADRPTTFIGPTRVEVSLSAADVAAAGTGSLRVRNPGPGSVPSAPAPFTVRALGAATATVTRVPLEGVGALVWDPGTARLYAAVYAGARADQVVAVDPAAGAVTAGVPMGGYPWQLARSDDGRFLYVGLRVGNSYRRITLGSLSVGPEWPLGTSARPLYPLDMKVLPGQPEAVAIVRAGAGVAVYDAGVPRPVFTESTPEASSIAFLESPGTLYGFNAASSGFDFLTIAVTGSGAQTTTSTRNLVRGFYTEIFGAAGRIYAEDGSVVDPERGVRVGSVPVPPFAGEPAIVPDPETGRLFMLTDAELLVYDLTSLQLLGTVPVPGQVYGFDLGWANRLVRFGTDGIAFYDQEGVVLVRSPLIAP